MRNIKNVIKYVQNNNSELKLCCFTKFTVAICNFIFKFLPAATLALKSKELEPKVFITWGSFREQTLLRSYPESLTSKVFQFNSGFNLFSVIYTSQTRRRRFLAWIDTEFVFLNNTFSGNENLLTLAERALRCVEFIKSCAFLRQNIHTSGQ